MSKTTNTKENGLEQHITDYLVSANNYVLRTSQDYNTTNCVDADLLFQFLENTQPKAVEKLKRYQNQPKSLPTQTHGRQRKISKSGKEYKDE